MEDKKEIIFRLRLLLKATRAGEDIKAMELGDDGDTVRIRFDNGGTRDINIACDSGIAIIKDVIAGIM